MSVKKSTELTVTLGQELFRFETFQQWVNKAASWYGTCGVHERDWVSIDSAGRICVIGGQFMRARDEEKFPITVYARDPDVVPISAVVMAQRQRRIDDKMRGGWRDE